MKFKVTMKDPDTLQDAIADAVQIELWKLEGLDDDDRESMRKNREENAANIARKWFEYGEYLCIEIDTDAGTCIVCDA